MRRLRHLALPILALLSIAAILTACGTAPKHKVIPVGDLDLDAIPDPTPRSEPLSPYGNPESYEADGRRYWIIPNPKGYVERGLASWYGPNFHGKRTSSGEPYDMYKMTAAHKTLPLPTYVRVTNLENGRSIVVKINDRGPFKDGRIIDLSYVAAAKLGITGDGTATVELHVLDDGIPTAPAAVPAGSGSGLSPAEARLPAPEAMQGKPAQPATTAAPAQGVQTKTPAAGGNVFIQVGAFSNLQNAERARSRLLEVQTHPVTISPVQGRYQTLQRVLIGPFPSKAEAEKLKNTLIELGFTGYRIITR